MAAIRHIDAVLSARVFPSKATYSVRVICRNCRDTRHIDIPKGRPINGHPCPRCGCCTLGKA